MSRAADVAVVLGLLVGSLAVAHLLTGGCAQTCGLGRLPMNGIRVDTIDTPPDEAMPFMYVRGDRIPDQDLWGRFEWINGAYVARLDDWAVMGHTVEITLSQGDDGKVVATGGITLSSDMTAAKRGVIALDSGVLKEATFCRFALDGDTEACGAFRIE